MRQFLVFVAICFLLLSFPSVVFSQDDPLLPDIGALFGEIDGTFVLRDSQHNITLHYNSERAAQRFPPFSTFKILDAAIALETGVIPDENYSIEWDRTKYPLDWITDEEPFVHWRQDHTLRSGMQYSVVWYYTEIALLIGQETMQTYLESVQYGNMNASFDRDDFPFWLNGSLQISADEQLRFLQAFYEEELVFSERTTAIVKDIILREETDTYRLSGKTGSGLTRDGVALGWFMGYVETQDNVYYFVTNMDAVGDIRVDLTCRILVELGVLPE